MQSKVYSMLGFAAKAGKILSGSEACQRAIKQRRVVLVILSQDASSSTKKKFEDMCKSHKVTFRYYGEKEFIGKFIGKDVRSVLIVNDENFAKRILELIDADQTLSGGDIVGEN